MNKVILPDGNTIVMDEVVFNQNPNFFMRFLVGSLAIGRITNNEADRLERIFDREFIKDILAKIIIYYTFFIVKWFIQSTIFSMATNNNIWIVFYNF